MILEQKKRPESSLGIRRIGKNQATSSHPYRGYRYQGRA